MHIRTMSATTGILLYNGSKIPFVIENYLTKMDNNCTTKRDRGISSKHYIEIYMLLIARSTKIKWGSHICLLLIHPHYI